MKKFLLGIICLSALSSCNVKDSDEYKKLLAERDSLMRITVNESRQITDLMSIVNEVEENFAQIKEAEKYLNIESNTKGELSNETKERIRSNFQMINDILKKNKADIEILNKRLKTATGQNATNLKQTINRLQNELEQRATALTELKTILSQKDQQIQQMSTEINQLSSNVNILTSQNIEQADKIKQQDFELNAGYYIFGTGRELKEAKIIAGGFISSPKVLKESIDKSIFLEIDIRKVNEIPVYAKKAKILSDQPADSYYIVKDQNGLATIKIVDYKKFWSLSQFLIIQVD